MVAMAIETAELPVQDEEQEEQLQEEPEPPANLEASLREVLAMEQKYQPCLSLPYNTRDRGEISMKMRNGAAHVLRCLKVWYDLPPDTFFNAISIMDRFLARMKAQPKHLSCIAVSAFHLSCQYTPTYGQTKLKGVKAVVPDYRELTTISQSKCTPGDVERMERIIVEKLHVDLRVHAPVTPLTLLRLLYLAHEGLAAVHLPAHVKLPPLVPIIHKLEILMCNAPAYEYRPTELAETLLMQELLANDKDHENVHHRNFKILCEQLLKVDPKSYEKCSAVVSNVIEQYENQEKSPHRQRLVWKLSNRTLRQLRPLDKYKKHLPTIEETSPHAPPTPPIPLPFEYVRMETDSSSSHDDRLDYDYDQEFPPLPTVSLKSPQHSPLKKQSNKFPYPQNNRKHGRIA